MSCGSRQATLICDSVDQQPGFGTGRDAMRERRGQPRFGLFAAQHLRRRRDLRFQSLEARRVLANFVVSSTDGTGEGTLAAAIESANQADGSDTITFDLTDDFEIVVTSLPTITDTVVIDGTTQSGYIDRPIINLFGIEDRAGSGSSGLRVEANQSVVRGLAFQRFIGGSEQNGAAITLVGSANLIEANYIGVLADGATPMKNTLGVLIETGSKNVIGGSDSGQGNLISGNGVGVQIRGANNRVEGNRIGTDATGTSAVSNDTGVEILNSDGNVIGGATAAHRNLISGNDVGVVVQGKSNQIRANYVGTTAIGTSAIGNGVGIEIVSGSGNVVGGSISDDQLPNVISGNSKGVVLAGSDNRVQGNYVGTDPTGFLAVGNLVGAEMTGQANLVGGTSVDVRNVISGNEVGVSVTGEANQIRGNWIGTNVQGVVALPNLAGIELTNATGTQIGGTSAEAANLVSGNQTGVRLLSSKSTVIEGNLIGLVENGARPLPNTESGISVFGGEQQSNRIGGAQPGAGNTISGNLGPGIVLDADGNFVEGNTIGRRAGQAADFGNGSGGVIILGANNQIGSPGAGNVIGGNFLGINLSGSGATGNRIQSNWIGTDELATDLGHQGDGIQVQGPDNTIGGSLSGEGNIIGHNRRYGVLVSGTQALNNQVVGNLIGLHDTESEPIPNLADGVHVTDTGGDSGNQIGGTHVEEGNRVWFNGGAGVAVIESGNGSDRSTGTQIRFNSIFENQGLGIDLGGNGTPDGVTPNDLGDPDEGPNQIQNFPVLTQFLPGTTTLVAGELDSIPGRSYFIDFYVSPSGDGTEVVQGQRHVGFLSVGPDDFRFSIELPVEMQPSDLVTATATQFEPLTDASDGTSEFAPAAALFGTKYTDFLADGITPDDERLADYPILLYADDGDGAFDPSLDVLLVSTTTDADGTYSFRDVSAGRHFVVEGVDERFKQTAGGSDFPITPYYVLDVVSAATFNGLDFANYERPFLSGRKVIDIDYNGVSENDEPAPGWAIQMYLDDGDGLFEPDQDDLIDTQVADETGRYEFSDMPPGDYFVVEVLQGDYEQTGGGDDFPELPYYVRTVVGGTVHDDLDFANFDFPDFSGTVYVDLTGDGISEDDDRHPGQMIKLFLDDGDGEFDPNVDTIQREAVTNLDGDYIFVRVTPGIYFVNFVVPDMYVQTDGGDSFPGIPYYKVEVQNGVDVDTLDFSDAKVASISGGKLLDHSGDGLTIDDTPFEGWSLLLYRDADGDGRFNQHRDQLVDTIQTDKAGEYVFDELPPGPYFVVDQATKDFRQTAGGEQFPVLPYFIVNLRSGQDVVGKTFANGPFYTTGLVTRQIDTGDFDRDGDIDVVAVSEFQDPLRDRGVVTVRFNDGQANFAEMRQFSLPGRPHSVKTADIDNDGDEDLIVSLVGAGRLGDDALNRVLTFFCNGDGTFQPGGIYKNVGNGPIDLATEDFDGDGDVDIAVASFRSNDVTILLNERRGFFVNAGHTVVGNRPVSVVAHHLNQDEAIDLVLANFASNTLSLLTNNGAGKFKLSGHVRTTPGPNDLAVADWDGDGDNDVAVTGSSFDQLDIHYGLRVTSNGGVSRRRSYSVSATVQATRPQAVAPVDFDGDGDLDVAVAASEVGVIAILDNRGGGFFTQGELLPTAGGPESVAVADLNGDHSEDIVSASIYRLSPEQVVGGEALGGINVTTNRNVDVAVSITNGRSVVVPGERVTYTVRVENYGPNDVEGVRVFSDFPEGFADVTYTSTPEGNTSGSVATGAEEINDVVSMESGSAIVYLVEGTVDAGLRGSFEVPMRTTVPIRYIETDLSNNVNSDKDDLIPVVDISVMTDDGGADADGAIVIPGVTDVIFTTTVTNSGPTTATEVRIVNSFALPVGTNVSSYSFSQGVFEATTNRWLVGDLAVDVTATATIVVNVSEDATVGDKIMQRVAFDHVAEIDAFAENNVDVEETLIGNPDAEPVVDGDEATPGPTSPRASDSETVPEMIPAVPAKVISGVEPVVIAVGTVPVPSSYVESVSETMREPTPAGATNVMPSGVNREREWETEGWQSLKGDFTGDGQTQTLWHVEGAWVEQRPDQKSLWGNWSEKVSWSDLLVGDVNGDQRDDIVGRTDRGRWWVGLSDGRRFKIALWGQWSTKVAWSDVALVDVTGDGKDELVGRTDRGVWWVSHHVGQRFVHQRWGRWAVHVGWTDTYFKDANGDGRTDVMGRASTGVWWVAESTGLGFVNRRR